MSSISDKKLMSSGSSEPVNSIKPIYNNDDVFIDSSGGTWFKTGYVSDDTASYPLATIKKFGKTGLTHAINGYTGLTEDSLYIWVLAGTTVYQYDKNWTATGVSFSISSFDTNPQGIFADESHLWVIGRTSLDVIKLNKDGTAAGGNFSISTGTSVPESIAVTTDYVYIGDGNSRIKVWDKSGTHITTLATCPDVPNDLIVKDGLLWALSNYAIYIYDFTGTLLSSYPATSYCKSFISAGTDALWIVRTDNLAYLHADIIGEEKVKTHTETGYKYFLKVLD
ncbi:hypothetical protein KIH87_16220 [Paraneptunicella aestuarii]|uniref:hypothetical protein n=1 Tax=Paraneptunicella aestuarii TaxID=2831148 RepID=UPI001E3FBFC7|nr:hypothetical protein [Paraneptunicella aestuarii]UAA38218.1 hypothetical protein KIH87_16220 [Paraneptunicella aestuarii]